MTDVSFKQKINAKEIKRADAMKVRLEDLHAEPGFNLRAEGPDLEASIDALTQHIIQGGQYPALEVRPRNEGGVWIVDGHRRHRAIIKAVEAGAPLQDKEGEVWVPIVAFEGNDADRVARIITSAEGRSLTPLETAMGYARLRDFGWDAARIAQKVGKTPQHVVQLLTLANANADVHNAVAAGTVSAAVAVAVVREHGEGAGKVLAEELDKAKAAGKGKVTAGTIKGKALPGKVVAGLVGSVDDFVGTLTNRDREVLARLEFGGIGSDAGAGITVSGGALLKLLKAHAEVTEARQAQEQKARQAQEQKAREAQNKAAQTELAA